MDENEVNIDELASSLGQTLQQASDIRVPALQRLTEIQDQRVKRLSGIGRRLSISLGADHPRVIALQRSASVAGSIKEDLGVTRERIARTPKPGPGDWMVTGTVYDQQGGPASGLSVRVYDRDRKYDDLLGETTTDEYGDFAVVYHERDFAEAGEKMPDLYIMVSDASGKLLYSSQDKVRYEAGKLEHFEITLPDKPPAEKKSVRTKRVAK